MKKYKPVHYDQGKAFGFWFVIVDICERLDLGGRESFYVVDVGTVDDRVPGRHMRLYDGEFLASHHELLNPGDLFHGQVIIDGRIRLLLYIKFLYGFPIWTKLPSNC